ncbi:AAA family ATPase [Eionea flava]
MYYSYFGLSEPPFSIAPNPSYLFMTQRHQEALAHLYHGIESEAGFVLLTGDVGTGKTTVCRRFLSELPNSTQVAFILTPCMGRVELLIAIAKELRIHLVNPNSKEETQGIRRLIDQIHTRLLENHAQGINTVLLIDEAQQLEPKVLEFVRLLTNLETDRQKLLKIILVGQPELNDMLAHPNMSQLSQRITARYHIYPLSLPEVKDYIAHRLSAAGFVGNTALFSARRIKQLFSMTQGVPRLVNVICDRALLGAYANHSSTVTAKLLNQAHREVQGNYIPHTVGRPLYTPTRKKHFRAWKIIFVLGAMLTILGVFLTSFSAERNHYLSQLGLWFDAVSFTDHSAPAPIVNKIDEPAIEAPSRFVYLLPEVDTLAAASPLTEVDRIDEPVAQREPTYYTSEALALQSLINRLVNPLPVYQPSQNVCDQLILSLWRCGNESNAEWELFEKYNRPAIVSVLHEGKPHYLTVVGINSTHAVTLSSSEENATVDIALDQLKDRWLGEFTFLWQAPLGFKRYIYKDSNATLIDWLANAFATLDRQDAVLTKRVYNSRLEQRIRLFQRSYQLKEDGKAGVETLLQLNDDLGIAMTLKNTKK